MEQTNSFLENPEVFNFFLNRVEKEFFIHMIGYHDFHHIKPEKFLRKQSCYTLHFVVSGKGYLLVNGKTIPVYPHEVFVLNDQTPFSYYPDKDDPWEYVFFEFGGPLAKHYVANADFSLEKIKKPCRHPQRVLTLLSDAFKKTGKTLSYFRVASLFFTILDYVCQPEAQTEFFCEPNFLEEVKHFIRLKYLNSDFNVEYLCSSMHISHSHLCRIFKQSENMSPIAYINRLKMARAEELLENTAMSVLEVSSASGFREYEYFLRLFKRMHGVSPTAYRKKCLEETENNE